MEESLNEVVEKNQVKKTAKRLNLLWLIVPILLIVFGILYFQRSEFGFSKEEVHYHAGFQVYVNGSLQDFSDIKYMTIGICGTGDREDEQIEKAHLHDNVGDVVHIHKEGAVWGDLFKNIKYDFDSTKPMKAYLNGLEVQGIFEKNIQGYDSLIIFIGEADFDKLLSNAVTREHIAEVEKKSESCSNNDS